MTKYVIAYTWRYQQGYRPFQSTQGTNHFDWLYRAKAYDKPPVLDWGHCTKVVTYEEALEIEREWRQMALLDEI